MVSTITSLTTLSTAIFNQTSNNATTTQSSSHSHGTCELETKTYVVLLGYVLIFFIGVTGNGLVLFSFRSFWRRGPVIELLILYLAFFNFLSSMLDPMMFGYWLVTCYKSWHLGWYGCKFVSPLCRIFTNISIGIILIMAIDRCRAIVFPFRKRLSRGQYGLRPISTRHSSP
ncbi:formyl peptide receptor-related sequence 7-like [Clytia hemisphaerica]|uniref:formyl peptide receptor-related sequence 7-like n=1 Tax=Clytia hemisphaerica TaxID=252671 RepID=UPI0034D796D1